MPMQLRSATAKAVKTVEKPKVEIPLTLLEFTGIISYHPRFVDCAFICGKLLLILKQWQGVVVIGFGMERSCNCVTGSGKIAVLHISFTLQDSILLHVYGLKKLPKALTELLSLPNIRLTGFNIKDDIRRLARDFRGVKSAPMLENCIDLRTMSRRFFVGERSMEALINRAIKMQINKCLSVRMSRWNMAPLSKVQKEYAGIRSFGSLKLYQHFKNLKNSK